MHLIGLHKLTDLQIQRFRKEQMYDVIMRDELTYDYIEKSVFFQRLRKESSYFRYFLSHVPEEMCISAITYAELMYGVEKSMAIEKNRIALSLFLSPLTILEFQASAVEEYGKARAELENKGMPIGLMDLLIAGHARSEGFILVTNNTREFCRVEGLVVED